MFFKEVGLLLFSIVLSNVYCQLPILFDSRVQHPPELLPVGHPLAPTYVPAPVHAPTRTAFAIAPVFAEEAKNFPSPVVRGRVKTAVRPIVKAPVAQAIEPEIAGVPEPYNFGYDVRDEFGNNQFRKEEGDNRGVVRGSYGYTGADGLYRVVEYIADENGFRANIKSNEPGLVDNPTSAADITLAAEEPPNTVREVIRQTRPPAERLRSGRTLRTAASSVPLFQRK